MIMINDLNIEIDGQSIIENLNLNVSQGEFVNLVGPNGGGKTTLLRALTSQIKYHGLIEIKTEKIGYLPQMIAPKKNFPITVLEVIKTGYQKAKDIDLLSISELLDLLEVSIYKNQRIATLSGGIRQRIYFIRAIISKPEVLLLDEATSDLDPDFRKSFESILKTLNSSGMTIINVTHSLSDSIFKDMKTYTINKTISEVKRRNNDV